MGTECRVYAANSKTLGVFTRHHSVWSGSTPALATGRRFSTSSETHSGAATRLLRPASGSPANAVGGCSLSPCTAHTPYCATRADICCTRYLFGMVGVTRQLRRRQAHHRGISFTHLPQQTSVCSRRWQELTTYRSSIKRGERAEESRGQMPRRLRQNTNELKVDFATPHARESENTGA